MRQYQDQTGRTIHLPNAPKRIVSLVPSQTELLCYLGLQNALVGRTKFCIHPADVVKHIQVIGGTKTPKIESILKLNPDLVVANKEENRKEDILAIESMVPVWVSDIHTIEEALGMILQLGILTDTASIAQKLCTEIQAAKPRKKAENRSSALYLIWRNPWMAAGNDTFVHDMMHCMGLENCLQEPRYPSLSKERIESLNPDFILLSSEPYPFKEKHLKEMQVLAPKAKILLVDGEYFSWYGSRMLPAMEYLRTLQTNMGLAY
jgi:ABC-type Fe3+-hydroxamate transport system substrate-binding protein